MSSTSSMPAEIRTRSLVTPASSCCSSLNCWCHWYQFWAITSEILEVRDPNALSTTAAQRKSAMLLLPYGIPIAIGTIGYFFWTGMLL